MAATQNALLSRTRPGRAPAASATKSITSAHLSISQTQATCTPSNISLFLSNLRLLNLDLLPDWPDINALTFTDKDAAQGQRKRSQCVEWALYQLVALWDPDDARNKLQPFFPPEDQLQSANLRSALLRSLDQAKKDGVLGRDIVLRKTMLDECKGERLLEVLAVFSSAVLKKTIAEEVSNTKTPSAAAQCIALEQRGYSGERADLAPLILAHKVSLRKKLSQKSTARALYKDFAQLLDSKERDVEGRQQHTSAIIGQANEARLTKDDETQVRRALRTNWTGNARWMDALVHGDAKSRQDGLLTAPFDRIWRRVLTNRLEEVDGESSGGLLEQLDDRVRVQQERLDKWQNFRKAMLDDFSIASEPESSGRITQQKGIDFGFGVHESIQLGQMSSQTLGASEPPQHGEYATLLDDLQAELKSINQHPAAQSLQWLSGRAQPAISPAQSSSGDKSVDEPISELSELEEELEEELASAAPTSRRPIHRDLEETTHPHLLLKQAWERARPNLAHPLSSSQVCQRDPKSTDIVPIESASPRIPSPRRSSRHERASKPPSPKDSPQRPPPPQSPLPRTQSPEEWPAFLAQHQADQILASMDAASPSPVKGSKPRHTLSLAERTRLSMVRGASVNVDEDGETAMGSPSPTRPWRTPTSSRWPAKDKPDTVTAVPKGAVSVRPADAEMADENDLAARTRRSMANFEATQQKARNDRQRSLKRAARQQSGSIARQSYFSSLDEEETEKDASENATAVLEELMAKEAEGVDYDSIFRSRPKIKTSPLVSPTRGGGMDHECPRDP